MVSKVAVIALVAILAVPILLGYGMNLQEVTETDYKESGDSVNVTSLLQNSVEYTDVVANTYQINSNFRTNYVDNASIPAVPNYNTISSIKSPYTMTQYFENNWSWPYFFDFTGKSLVYFVVDYNYPSESFWIDLRIRVGGVDSTLLTVNNLHEYYYDGMTHTFYYAYYNSIGLTYGHVSNDNILGVQYNQSANWSGGTLKWGQITTTTNTYADISAGYYFNDSRITPTIRMPDNTKSFIMSLNLDSITAANYTRTIEIYPDAGLGTVAKLQLTKSTVGGVVSWKMATGNSLSDITDLYYDPSRNDNTYQLYVNMSDKEKVSSTQEKVTVNCSMKYVGGWPPAIGSANSYTSYDFEYESTSVISQNLNNGLARISFDKTNTRTPTVRMDAAITDGYEVPVIADQVYNPASFKTNPSTTIGNVTKYGSSLSFGGNTYTISKGNITLGSHTIPVNGLVLSSIPNENGGYDNMIGKTIISNTVDPSAITFNGHWSASISTVSMESYNYTHTEWTAGEFAWNGIDENFLMIGLLTSLGAFIALGIYMRRTKAALWPLLLVCGGAAMLFFCML